LSPLHPPTTHIYTLSLHDALPICPPRCEFHFLRGRFKRIAEARGRVRLGHQQKSRPLSCCRLRSRLALAATRAAASPLPTTAARSEEHTSELQSLRHLVCRLLLEK